MKISDKGKNAIIGALVADAATLGTHWIYDQPRIKAIAPVEPEFVPPSADYLDGSFGYFAHAGKAVGDNSHYGHQMIVMLRSLAMNDGLYDEAKYLASFCEYFGYGGQYIGYIDRATKDTLNNVARGEEQALNKMMDVPFQGSDDIKRSLTNKIISVAKQSKGQALRVQVEKAIRLTDDDDSYVAHAMNLINIWEQENSRVGSMDIQLPATSKLPPLVACYAQNKQLTKVAESAIRVTNDNLTSVGYGVSVALMIEAAIHSGDINQVLSVIENLEVTDVKEHLSEAMTMLEKSTAEVTSHFGLACNLSYGIPSITHNLATATSYTEAVRNNIYAGGDNCGRAIVLGAFLGACYGVGGPQGIPEAWISRVEMIDEVNQLLNSLL